MVDIDYFRKRQKLIELRYNPYHDPSNGRFTSGGGGGGGFLYSPNKKKGEKGMNGDGTLFYVAPDTLDKGEKALANEYEEWIKSQVALPPEIQAKVQRVKDIVSKGSVFGDLEGDIQVSIDNDGNYILSYSQVKNYGKLRSATIGVGDIPARKEVTHTTHVLHKSGRRIKTIRKTDTYYLKNR